MEPEINFFSGAFLTRIYIFWTELYRNCSAFRLLYSTLFCDALNTHSNKTQFFPFKMTIYSCKDAGMEIIRLKDMALKNIRFSWEIL